MQLSEADIKNLLVFLSRVNLTGHEAPILTDIVQKLNASITPKLDVNDNKKEK